MRVIEGNLIAKGLKFALIVSRFNDFITLKLQEGAIDTLIRLGAEDRDMDVYKVPGSFEIPSIALKIAESKKYNAIICLGTIIRGETPHFDYISSEVAKGIAQASFKTGVPVIYGIVTADTVE